MTLGCAYPCDMRLASLQLPKSPRYVGLLTRRRSHRRHRCGIQLWKTVRSGFMSTSVSDIRAAGESAIPMEMQFAIIAGTQDAHVAQATLRESAASGARVDWPTAPNSRHSWPMPQ